MGLTPPPPRLENSPLFFFFFLEPSLKYTLLGERRVYFLISNLILMDRGNATKVWFHNMNN